MEPELPDSLYAPEQLQACIFEMERLVAWRHSQDVKEKTGNKVQAAPDFAFSTELVGLLGEPEGVARWSIAQLHLWHSQLQAWLEQPVTHLTFAAPPPAATKLAMVTWFRTEISPTALLKFGVNRNILGGLVIRTRDRIFDLSFRRRLLENQDKIPEIFKRA